MNSITEARCYLDNARAILREKANKEEGYYQDAQCEGGRITKGDY